MALFSRYFPYLLTLFTMSSIVLATQLSPLPLSHFMDDTKNYILFAETALLFFSKFKSFTKTSAFTINLISTY